MSSPRNVRCLALLDEKYLGVQVEHRKTGGHERKGERSRGHTERARFNERRGFAVQTLKRKEVIYLNTAEALSTPYLLSNDGPAWTPPDLLYDSPAGKPFPRHNSVHPAQAAAAAEAQLPGHRAEKKSRRLLPLLEASLLSLTTPLCSSRQRRNELPATASPAQVTVCRRLKAHLFKQHPASANPRL
ncbi:hypothetical protein SKAU_G00045380 [Synaphobranchus kaupii]|uniref:Uncharacterized protein n=1 Tax=Synaphobranchus kaupii TaxID=118154 RepID=A0A9Q1G1X2_SYNKA|nr:hypothetical protein SKAU_G00045380 [Synaphobranchus kaupii]